MADDKKKFVIANDEFDDIDATTKNVVITDSEFDDIDDSPKSPAPSMKGGESGALVRPLTPTSASEGSESESWTQTVNPFADKGAVKPTQQAGAAQAPKAKLLKVIPSSEKKSPELLKARVDTYGDMYKRAMDRAYTLKQSVEGVDNELKNSKAYVDSNPNDQNAINSYNALISKRNEMAEMARMEISRADAWQKGIEKTQLEIDESLTASESISNSISNMATQIKGFLPASGLAISTLQNKIQQGAMYVAGKLMGADDETASRVSTELSQNLPSAGILGTTQKEARQFYTERLGELEKEQKPTKSIIKTFEEGDIAGLGAAILDGGSSVISSVITSAPTGGVGIFTEMMGRSVYDSNNEKAKRLKISVDELYDRGLDEAAVPLAIGAVSASLEKIGLDGISKAINKKIGSKALKDVFEIILEGSKEAGTEWLQTGAEEYNKAIARGMNAEQAGEAALSKMLSEEGREAALKGAAGSGVSIATGRAAKSLYSIAKSNRDKLYQDLAKVETLARERANPNLSSEALASIDREINNTTANMQKEVLDQLNRRANLTEENASLVEGIEANVKTISDDIESKKLLSEDPSLSDDAKIIIDLEIADLEAKRLDLSAQSEEIIKNNRPIELKKNTSPTNEKYGTINRNDGKGVVDLTKEEYLREEGKLAGVEEQLNEQEDVDIQQQVDEEKADDRAVGDIAKEDNAYQESRQITEEVSRENPDASILITPKGNDLNLTALYVGKENRGKGIGSKVLESVKKQADKVGKKVVLDATNELDEETDLERLGKFYEANGFTKVGDNKFEYNPNKGDIAKKGEAVSKEETPVLRDVEPIRQLGTGANVYFETDKHRVNDDLKSGKVLLNVGSKEDEVPMANIEFDNAAEAVAVAKELDRIYPKGVPNAVLIDNVVEDIRKKQAQEVKAEQASKGKVEGSLRDVELSMRRPDKNEIVFVSVDALLEKHAKDQPSYDIQKPENRIKGRVEKAKEYIKNYIKDQRAINPKTGERMKTKVSFEPSVVDIGDDGKISFEDGRHRVLAAKELGLTEVPIEVPREKLKAVKSLLSKEQAPKQKEDEQEKPTKEDGKPLPKGVQGLRTEGQAGKESAELRTEEEEVTPQAGSVGVEGEVEFGTAFNIQEATAENTVGKEKDLWGRAQVWRERIENAGDILRELSSRGDKPDVGYLMEKVKKLRDWIAQSKKGYTPIDKSIKTIEDFEKTSLRWSDAVDSREYIEKFHSSVLDKIRSEYEAIPTYTKEQRLAVELVLDLINNNIKGLESKLNEIENISNQIKANGKLPIIADIKLGKAVEQSLKETPQEELLTPKQEEDAKKQQSGQMREQGVQDQPQRKGDSDMPIINEAELQDGEAVEEEVTQEELNKQQDKETQVLLNGEAAKRRSAGKFIKDGVEYVRNKVDKGIRGIKGSVKFAEGVPNMPFTYKLVEAETLQPSHSQGVRNQMHFIPEAQPKRRNDEGSVAAEIGFANNPRFNELGENTNAYSGAPVVNERNEVVQGNNRSAGLKIGYDRGNKKYKNDLADNAEKFGFTREQVEGMKNPVLVREVAFSDEGAIEYGNYDAKDLETGGKRRIDPLALVKRIPLKEKARLAKLLFSGEGTLNSNIRANSKDVLAILNPFLNQAQRTTLLKDGEITSSGVEDIEALVQQFLFDNGDMALPELFENLPYRQREGIRKSLPFIFSAGVEADVIPEIQNAILALNQFQSTGIENFDTWLNQSDVFADNKTPRDIYTPQELAIARALNEAKTQSEIVDKFKSFSSAVQGTPETPANLIDEAKPAIEGQSKEEALKQIFNVKENESRQKENLRGGKKVNKQQEAPKQKPKEPTAEEVEEEGLPKLTKEQQIEAERRSLNEPKNVSDLAKIFNKILGLSPKESVMAARLFDVKAKNMSELLGITKDEYYQRYWFTGELSEKGKQLNQIVGENAQLAKDIRDNLQVARDMEAEGKDAKTIRLATGWEKGADGKWRYEIADIKNLDKAVFNKSKKETVSLYDLVGDNEIFKAYPELKKIKVKSGKESFFNAADNTIILSDLFTSLSAKSTLIHELQHAIQFIEGFAYGTTGGREMMSARARYNSFIVDKLLKENKEYRDLYIKADALPYYVSDISLEKNKEREELDNRLQDIFDDYIKKNPIDENKLKEIAKKLYHSNKGEIEARNVQKRMNMTPEQRRATTLQETEDVARDEQIVLFGEQEGGLSQMTLPDGRKVTVKSVSAEVVNGFYSNTENALGQVKQEKMSGNQWATQLLSRGANKEEMGWTGLEAFLKENAAKSISKADIQQYLKDNRISINEVVLGSVKVKESDLELTERPIMGGWAVTLKSNGKKIDIVGKEEASNLEEAKRIAASRVSSEDITKFSDYQLQGEKENYKELLVTMPSKETEEGLPEGYKIIKKEDYKGAWEGTENFVIVDYDGYSVMQGKTEKEALSSFNKLRKGTTPDKNAKFKSTHFSEPNILVHLRMNTRTDAEGNKVLFLEEVQSDWGQEGKKEGFRPTFEIRNEKGNFNIYSSVSNMKEPAFTFDTKEDANKMLETLNKANESKPLAAPFVMDTNAWTKLGLKVALKEAVKQGADKIAWSTGTQQFDRWGSEKIDWKKNKQLSHYEKAQFDMLDYKVKYQTATQEEKEKRNEFARRNQGGFVVNIDEQVGGNAFDGININEQALSERGVLIETKNELKSIVKKSLSRERNDAEIDKLTDRIWNRMQTEDSGTSLPRKEGMEAFYGVPSENKLGIVGNVAKSLFKQEPKTIELDIKDYDKFTVEVFDEDGDRAVWTFDNKDKAKDFAEMKGGNIVPKKDKKQHSIDITPELKAQVQEGLPLFQDRRGAWSKIAASAKRIISMYDKARLDTAVHEILGHDFLDEIISLSATNKEFEQDLNTIIDEYIKSSGNKTSKATLLNELKNFNVESNNQSVNARAIHEWFSRTAEGYFMGETNIKPDSKLAKMFEQFRQYLTDLFNTMTSRNYIIPSEPMKQIFRKAFGAENFDFVNDYAEANIMEGKLDVLRITENEIPQSRLDKFKKLREERKGLGQEEDVDIDELVDAARYLSTDPTVNVFNVVDELVSMYPQKEEYIRKHSKTFEKVFVAEGKKVRETARSVYESDVVSPEMKQRAATIEDLFSYTPEKLQEKMEDVESLIADYSIDDLMAFFATSNEIPFKEYPLFLAAMQKRISRAINELNNSNQGQSAAKQKLLNYEMTIMDRYIAEGTATGQRLNYFKVLKNMSTDGKLRFFKRKFKEESGNAVKEFQDLISNLRKERDKAYKDNDYFLEENLSLEQRIEDLEAELAKERSTKAKNDKRNDRESLSQAKPPKRKISQSELNDILKELGSTGLGQSLEDLNAALKLGFYIIQDKPKTIEQFTKDWNKITKQNKTQEELSQVYRDVRKYATENEGVDIDYFDSDAMIQSSIDSFNERASQKKNLAKKELDSDIAKAEKEAMKTQMSEKDKEVKAKEALKKREKEIRDNFLDSLSQDGLWQQYVKSVSGRILGNLGSKLGAKQSEKALLDEFTQLATNELNKAIDELMPKQKGGKAATPNYAQQLGDLIANQEKLADIFDKAVKDFAEKNKGNANAQSILSKLNGLKNPFSEKLMENALEKEAQNYAIKIGDLAFKYAGLRQNLKDQIVAQIVAETGLTGQQATQLEQDLRAKFDNIIAETEQDTAGQLAKAILSNAKKELGLGKKQQDYVKELLGYLKNKAKDYYKTTNKQALVDPFEQLKYAVEMLNDANGRKIWDDSKAELIAKIDSDKDLSQQEKDDLKAYLNDYQNAIFDQLLSKNKLFNNVKKVLAEESTFVKKDGSVDWNGIIIQAKGNVEIAKQIILDSVADKLQGYSGSQVNSVIDAIGREYQRRINEKRAEIIEKQLKDISDKKVIFKKKIATGFVQKLVEMENSGALGDQRFEQALKEWIGFSDMTPDKWSRLRELIVDAEEAPEGNERDRAIENLSAYIKFNKIGKFAEIYASAYYAGLLARPTTIIKNSTGIIEPLLTLFYKFFTDRNYAKAMLQGLKRGDAADIWGGGLVQGGKLDEEVGNDGLPRVNMLKQWRMQQKGIIPKLFALGAKPLDLLSMADALSQAMVERGAEYEFYARYLLEKNKEDIRNGVQGVVPITEKEARRIAIKRLSDDAMLDWAFAQAEDEFASRKIVPSSARLNRRAYEIVSESLLPTSVRELAQNLALEESYKSKLISFRGMTSQTRAQKRLETNYGVATFIGSFAKGLVDLLAEGVGYVAGGATKVLPVTEARRNQIRNSVERSISMRVLPFARGISNVVEKSLEKTPYGIVSGVIGATAEKLSYGKPKTIDEILQHQYMMNRNKAKIAKSATSMIIGSAIYYTLLSASKEWDDEEEKEERYYLPTGFYSAGETVRFGKNKIERYTLPVNCVVLYGRIIPLSLFGTVGIGSMITAQAYDNFLSKEKKKQGAVVDPDNPESIKGFSSFVSSSGNAILNMSAMQSISELQESVSSKGTMDFGDYASKLSVKSIALPIPFSGTANQIIQGARYLSGDKTAQAAIGADEKIYKELGLAGIVYNRPVLDWRGRPVNAVLQNQEGIASFVSMLDKRPLDKIDMYLLKELEFNPVIDKRLSENFADLNMVGMSKDEYYDYTKNVGRTVNNYIEAYFDTIKNYQIPQDKIDELAAEGKNETDLKKQLKTIKKTFVSDFLNIAEQEHMLNYQFSKGIINGASYEAKFKANNDRLENLIEKINDKGE